MAKNPKKLQGKENRFSWAQSAIYTMKCNNCWKLCVVFARTVFRGNKKRNDFFWKLLIEYERKPNHYRYPLTIYIHQADYTVRYSLVRRLPADQTFKSNILLSLCQSFSMNISVLNVTPKETSRLIYPASMAGKWSPSVCLVFPNWVCCWKEAVQREFFTENRLAQEERQPQWPHRQLLPLVPSILARVKKKMRVLWKKTKLIILLMILTKINWIYFLGLWDNMMVKFCQRRNTTQN